MTLNTFGEAYIALNIFKSLKLKIRLGQATENDVETMKEFRAALTAYNDTNIVASRIIREELQ